MQNSPHLLTFDVYILLMISITQSQIQMIVFNGMFDVHRGILLKDRPCYQSNDSIQSFTDCVVTCALNTSCQASFLTVYNLCGYCPPGSIYSVEPRKNETVAFPIGLKISGSQNISNSCPTGVTSVYVTYSNFTSIMHKP